MTASATQIADWYARRAPATLHGTTLHGTPGPAPLTRAVPFSALAANTFSFFTGPDLPEGYDHPASALVCVTHEAAAGLRGPGLAVDNPRLAFGRCVAEFLAPRPARAVHPTAVIEGPVDLGADVAIGPGCVLAAGTVIGAGSTLHANVVIGPNVVIGARCEIRSGTIIGEAGFGVETDVDGSTFRLPHVGGVHIGDDVSLGSLNSVASGTLVPTVIEAHVQTDNLVHIAHNVRIGAASLLTACAEISGSVDIGRNVWIGPNASVMHKIAIGDHTVVGLGAVVTRSLPENVVVAGSPARILPGKPGRKGVTG